MAISPAKPSFLTTWTAIGTDAPARTLMLAGVTRQREIRPRLADSQAVGILRAALLLSVGQMEIIRAVGGQRDGDQRIGVVRQQARRSCLRNRR